MPDEIKDDEKPDNDGNESPDQSEAKDDKDESLKDAGKFASIFSKNFKILWKDYMEKNLPLSVTFEHYVRDTIQELAHKLVKELWKQSHTDPDSPYRDILSKWASPFFDASKYDVAEELFQRNKKPMSQVLDMDLAGMDAVELGQTFLMSDDDDDDDKDGFEYKIGVPKPKVKLKVKPLELVQHGFHPEALEEIQLYERIKLSYKSELIDFKAKLKLEGSLDMEDIRKWDQLTLPVLEKKAGGSAELELQLMVHPENQPLRFSINGTVGYSNIPHPDREGRREEKVEGSIGVQLELFFEDRKRRDDWERLLRRERPSR